MVRKQIIALLIIMGVSFVSLSSAVASDWEHVGETDGVDVHSKELPDSDLFAFRGEMTADVPIGKIITVYTNPNQRPHWVHDFGDSETLDITRTSERYWIKFDLSWPATDRDFVFQADYDFDADNRKFTARIRSVEDERKPDDDCCVRAEGETTYTFEAIPGQEMTRIVVESQTDPKGRLPGRLVRRTQRDWPVVTLTNLVERASASGIDVDPRVSDWHDVDE